MKDKIPFYEVVNMFFTGAVFSILLFFLLFNKITISEELKRLITYCENWNVIVGVVALVLMYEIGFILNKVGSITIAPLFKALKIWPTENYNISVSKVEAKYSKFRSLNTELHVIRTHIVMFLILSTVSLITEVWYITITFLVITAIFILSGRRINNFMNKIKEGYILDTTKTDEAHCKDKN